MENSGWIKLHRRILDDPIITDDGLFRLFIYCLLNANFKEKTFLFGGESVTVSRGQFITGRKVLAKQLRVKDTTIYYRLRTLEKLKYVSVKSNNQYSLLTVINYDSYAAEIAESEQQENNKVTTV